MFSWRWRAMRRPEPYGIRSAGHCDPQFLDTLVDDDLLTPDDVRSKNAKLAVSQSVVGLVAAEKFAAADAGEPVGAAARRLIGPPAILVLERLGGTTGNASHRFDA